MTLAPLDLLAAVVAPDAAALGGLDALAGEHGRCWAGLAPGPLAVEHDQVMVDRLPCAGGAESDEPAIHGRDRGKVFWQQAPGGTAAQDIEDGVDDLPHLPLAMSATTAWRSQQR